MQQTENKEIYEKLSEPFASQDAANLCLEAFQKELGVLREKHGIRDVIVVVEILVKSADGATNVGLGTCEFGDPLKKLMMLTRALLSSQKLLTDFVARNMEGGIPKQPGPTQ